MAKPYIPPVNAEVVRINRGAKILFRGRQPVYASQEQDWSDFTTSSGSVVRYSEDTTEIAVPSNIVIDLELSASDLPPAEPDEMPAPGSPDGPPIPPGTIGGGGVDPPPGWDYEDPDGTSLPEYPYIPPPDPGPLPEPVDGSYHEYLSQMLGYMNRHPQAFMAYSAWPWPQCPPTSPTGTDYYAGTWTPVNPPEHLDIWGWPDQPPENGTMRPVFPYIAGSPLPTWDPDDVPFYWNVDRLGAVEREVDVRPPSNTVPTATQVFGTPPGHFHDSLQLRLIQRYKGVVVAEGTPPNGRIYAATADPATTDTLVFSGFADHPSNPIFTWALATYLEYRPPPEDPGALGAAFYLQHEGEPGRWVKFQVTDPLVMDAAPDGAGPVVVPVVLVDQAGTQLWDEDGMGGARVFVAFEEVSGSPPFTYAGTPPRSGEMWTVQTQGLPFGYRRNDPPYWLVNPWWTCAYELGGLHLPLCGDFPLYDHAGTEYHGSAVEDSGVLVAGAAARTGSAHEDSSTYFNGTDGRIVTEFQFPSHTKDLGPRQLFGPDTHEPNGDEPQLPPGRDNYDHPGVYPSHPNCPPFSPGHTANNDPVWSVNVADTYYEAKGSNAQFGNVNLWARREDTTANHVLMTGTGMDRWRLYAPGDEHPFLTPKDLCLEVASPRAGVIQDADGPETWPDTCTWWRNALPEAGEWFHLTIVNALRGGQIGAGPWRVPRWQNSFENIMRMRWDPWWGDNPGTGMPLDFPRQGAWTVFVNGVFKGQRMGGISGHKDAADRVGGFAGSGDIFATQFPRRIGDDGLPIMSDPPVAETGSQSTNRNGFWGDLVLGSDAYTDFYPWGPCYPEDFPDGLQYRSWKGNVVHLGVQMVGMDEAAGEPENPDPYGPYPWFYGCQGAVSYAFLNPGGVLIPYPQGAWHKDVGAMTDLYARYNLKGLAAVD